MKRALGRMIVILVVVGIGPVEMAGFSPISLSPDSAFAADAKRIAIGFGPEEQIHDVTGALIEVPGYSVPSFAHWDGDDLEDLIIGEGSASYSGKVRVYLNVGTAESPAFSESFFAQSDGADLALSGGGCVGASPRVVYWDDDERKDLVVGLADGTIELFLNIGTDDDPTFDAGSPLQVGEPGAKVDIDVGNRTTLTVADWNEDGRKDIVAGAYDGKIHVFLNEGTDTGCPTFAPRPLPRQTVPIWRSQRTAPAPRSSISTWTTTKTSSPGTPRESCSSTATWAATTIPFSETTSSSSPMGCRSTWRAHRVRAPSCATGRVTALSTSLSAPGTARSDSIRHSARTRTETATRPTPAADRTATMETQRSIRMRRKVLKVIPPATTASTTTVTAWSIPISSAGGAGSGPFCGDRSHWILSEIKDPVSRRFAITHIPIATHRVSLIECQGTISA